MNEVENVIGIIYPHLCENCEHRLMGRAPYIIGIRLVKLGYFPYNDLEVVVRCPNCNWYQSRDIDGYFDILKKNNSYGYEKKETN